MLAKRLSFKQFHNRKGHPAFVAQIEDNHDIGMRERSDSPGLALETRQGLTITRQVLPQNFLTATSLPSRETGAR